MQKTSQKVIRYWRSCVSDSTLGKGIFSRKDLEERYELSAADLANGSIQPELAKQLFSGKPETVQVIPIRFWPRLAARNSSHGRRVSDDLPKNVAPIVTEGQLSRDGMILPESSFITRDVLEPLAKGTFSIGTIDDLDKFLTISPFRSGSIETENGCSWQKYQDYSNRMLDEVVSNWPEFDDDYLLTGTGLLEVTEDGSSMVRRILELYDAVLKGNQETPLLSTYANIEMHPPSDFSVPNEFAQRLGYSNDRFPLTDQQRDALNHLSINQIGDVTAVNGPPGTGKTTMLLSAIAGEWISAALEGGDPPIIVAASANNQAVTNIIDAFGKDYAKGKGPFAGRWLPDISSFGLYLPAYTKEEEASKSYQTERFFLKLETEGYVSNAKQAFVASAQKALPDMGTSDLTQIVSALRELIQVDVNKLSSADGAWNQLKNSRSAIANELGDNPEEALGHRKTELDHSLAKNKDYRQLQSQWDGYLANEFILLSALNFLPPIARKRQLKARDFLNSTGYSDLFDRHLKVDEISKQIQQHLLDCEQRYKNAKSRHEQAEQLFEDLHSGRGNWKKATEALGLKGSENIDFMTCDQHADTNTRFHLFLLATHYWEGRWLLEMEHAIPTEKDRRATGMKSVVPRWHRRMMLTPCAVSTFASLPGKMIHKPYEGGTFPERHLFNFIDLLIVDEAGQVLPEVAGASFALAKKALVIGDTQQIEPISSLPKSVDIGNLQESGLITTNVEEGELQSITELGIRSTNGSAMHAAQTACSYHPYPELDRGLHLFEHHRCYDEIISYCNALCYKGTLVPRRGSADKDTPLVPLGYLHIDGASTSSGGSRSNTTEAKTIAAWLAAHRKKLEQQYGEPLEKLVGILTPFAKQAREISRACADNGIQTGKEGMTIGTVHSLQGAERPIVIFSPVYSKHADGKFIDRSASMLNVAVSRAKDSFFVFGDMDVFSTALPGSPRALLASFLHADPANALEFKTLPREDLGTTEGNLSALQDAKEHDAFLLETLASDAQKICVVSPWIILSTMERTGILAAFKEARKRDVVIEIYVDPILNDGIKPTLEQAEIALKGIGIELKKVRQLHSKIVVVDDNMLCVGSFNWLSADRTGKYARHETSLVYCGTHLADEIDVITESLKKRQIVIDK